MTIDAAYEGLVTEADANAWVDALRGQETNAWTEAMNGPLPPVALLDAPSAPAPVKKDPRSMYSRTFWMAASERAVKTFAQTMVAALGIGSTGLIDLNWPALGALAASAAVASVLTSLAGLSGPQSDANADA